MKRVERHEAAQAPQSFGRYRIRGVLGEGGMGRLYVAEQTGIEGFAKIVALKRILPHLADSAPFRKLFLNEARVAARLEHPNIVGTYELGEVDGTYFMALEYLPGEDLAAILEQCETPAPMPIEMAASLVQQAATGLRYAHNLREASGQPSGLVHCDVNPSNIFVTYYGMVKLLDFGVVKASTLNDTTSPGLFKGKYAYCAPEQLQGDPVDHRTDVFCLGIVLWECLTGHRLFAGPNEAATIDAVRGQAVVPPSLLRPQVPFRLDEITLRALARDPSHRYQDAGEMADALEQLLTETGHRPTSTSIGQWLESLFGAERAALKKSIAQGSEVESALAKLATASPAEMSEASARNMSAMRPRPLWSTGMARQPLARTPAPPPQASQVEPLPPRFEAPAPEPAVSIRPRSPWRAVVGIAVGFLLAAGIGVLVKNGVPAKAPPATTVAGLEIQTTPAGANIFIDGNPSGLVTPATLRDLRPAQAMELRLTKDGYAPFVRRMEIGPG